MQNFPSLPLGKMGFFSSSINQESPIDLILTPKDIKENVERSGFIIAKAIEENYQEKSENFQLLHKGQNRSRSL